jgi:hypothetical protein
METNRNDDFCAVNVVEKKYKRLINRYLVILLHGNFYKKGKSTKA